MVQVALGRGIAVRFWWDANVISLAMARLRAEKWADGMIDAALSGPVINYANTLHSLEKQQWDDALSAVEITEDGQGEVLYYQWP